MIALLDVNKQIISLYGKEGMVEIPFKNVHEIYEYVDDNNVYYIIKAMQVDVKDIINMIKGMGINVQQPSVTETGNKYIHGVSEEVIFIDSSLKFNGKFDCKSYDAEMQQLVNQTPLLQQLINAKKIEIIGEVKRSKLLKELKKVHDKQEAMQKKADEKLDSMILSTSVKDYEGMPSDEHDAMSIDILKGGKTEGGVNTMSELLDIAEGFEEK